MDRKIRFVAILFLAVVLCACNRGNREDFISGPYVPAVSSPIKIRVVDVSNDTHRVFDVDVIGLLWGGLEDSLKKRGMLWNPQAGGKPYTIEARVVEYKKGSIPGRLVPMVGDVVLKVTCDIRDGDRQIATIESKHKFGYASELLSRNAWKKIFADVAEDVITQATRKL
ncbi:MAG: hypothetical protein WAW37_17005 [Syntrophobacteraceae bacterium]